MGEIMNYTKGVKTGVAQLQRVCISVPMYGTGDLKNTCSGPHYVCEKCNKRVGSNWVICTMCVEDRVHGCHRKISACV